MLQELDCVVPGASAILRLMKSIFSASKALVEIQDYLVELFIDRISSNLGLVDKYRQLFPSNPDLLSSVLDIYTVVLEIGTRAVRIFYDGKGNKRSGLRLFTSAAWSSSKVDLETLCRKFVARLDTFDRAARLALSQATTSGFQGVASIQMRQEIQLQYLESGLLDHTGFLMEAKSQRDVDLLATKAQDRRDLLRWIGQETAKLDCAAIHDKLRRAAVEGTGQWLLKHNMFTSWLSQQGPGGLWVTGKWGTGKSVLASTIIHSLLERSHLDEDTVCAYLYCSSEYPFLSSSAVTGVNSGKRVSYKAILGSLLYQLYGALPPDRDIDSMLHFWRQATPLLESNLEQAIMHAITMLGRVFIVIDGLDELQHTDDADFRAFCRFIGSLNNSSLRGSVLVLSRPDYHVIASAMEGTAVLKIDSQTTLPTFRPS
ncbi:hypothetical protein GE09DRAFT_303017 [Coniochaeta sp. 2T2.1]|nr:hypothetical protein GE09DRAFT_303017 [Coniochaeta sp. 2T2.1]